MGKKPKADKFPGKDVEKKMTEVDRERWCWSIFCLNYRGRNSNKTQ